MTWPAAKKPQWHDHDHASMNCKHRPSVHNKTRIVQNGKEARSVVYRAITSANGTREWMRAKRERNHDWDEGRWMGEGKPGRRKEGIKVEKRKKKKRLSQTERRWRRRRDRPEFVQLGESVSSGITSQNGQTQTEERKMDVRGCTKGKGGDGGEEEGRREGDAIAVITGCNRFGGSEWGRRGWREGGTQHDNNTTRQWQKQRAQNTQTKS